MDETLFATVLRNFQYALRVFDELTLTTKRDSRNFLERLLFKDMY